MNTQEKTPAVYTGCDRATRALQKENGRRLLAREEFLDRDEITTIIATETAAPAMYEALELLKAACLGVLIQANIEAIKRGYKMDTWTPEQMQFSKAVEVTDAALAAARKGGAL